MSYTDATQHNGSVLVEVFRVRSVLKALPPTPVVLSIKTLSNLWLCSTSLELLEFRSLIQRYFTAGFSDAAEIVSVALLLPAVTAAADDAMLTDTIPRPVTCTLANVTIYMNCGVWQFTLDTVYGPGGPYARFLCSCPPERLHMSPKQTCCSPFSLYPIQTKKEPSSKQ